MVMDVPLLRRQAFEALQNGNVERAVDCLVHALRLQPGDTALYQELAECHWAAYGFSRALETCAHALEAGCDPAAIGTFAAKKLFGIGRFHESARWLERAVAGSPGNPVLLTLLGEVYERGNQLTEAEHCANRALALAPSQVKTVRLLAHIERRHGRFDDARRRLTGQLERFPGPEDWRLRYELAAVLDRLGDYDAAMSELLAAKKQLQPQAAAALAEAAAIRERQLELARLLRREDYDAWLRTGLRSPMVPIAFLCGHPRSGTTLLEQILDAHDGVIGTDESGVLSREFIGPILRQPPSAADSAAELRRFGPDEVEQGRDAYLRFTEAQLGESIGRRLLVEKEPTLTPDLPLPLRLFPEGKIIFPLRDPRDVCVSYFFTLVPLGASSAASIDLRSTCEACAHSLVLWTHWKTTLPFPCLESRYETLVRQPEAETRRVLNFLELPWNEKLLSFHEQSRSKQIRTPTYADAAQPLYQRAIGRWKNYEKHLAPHLDILLPHLRAFGYE